MDVIAIRRLRVLPIPRGPGLRAEHALGMLSELAGLGYAVQHPERLQQADPRFVADYPRAIEALRSLRGGDVDYVPLFVGFPDEVPDDREYFMRRIIGYLGNLFGAWNEGAADKDEWTIPPWLFDLRQFGADPITQMQDRSLWLKAREAMSERIPDRHTEWLDLTLCWEDEADELLKAWLRDALYARSSIKEELHDDIRALLSRYGAGAGIDCDRISIQETKALVMQAFWESGHLPAVVALARTPTDLLRLFAALTGTDISLATTMRFPKMTRAQRRAVLSVIDQSPSAAEDLNRYRGLWLELGRYVHPGEYRRRFSRAAAAFDQLRNGTVVTFESQTESLIADRDLRGVLEHLHQRPGLLARRLHELLRRFPDGSDEILAAFADVAPQMTTKALLILRRYFATIDDLERRTVINRRGRIKVLPNNARLALRPSHPPRIDQLVRDALHRQLSTRESWGDQRVWIDPALDNYTVPLQQRTASDGVLTFGRGSRIPVDFDRVLRLFVYWKQASRRTDLDLSVIQFDESFTYKGHVSYTALSGQGIVHSGDLQSAPHGAAEFIDISLSALPKDVHYLAVQVYRYCGEHFRQMQCHAGWMIRDKVDARMETFDIKTVAHKFDLTGVGAYCVPLLVDLRAQQIVLIDLYMSGRAFHNNVEGAHGDVALACREIARFTTTRPTMAQLARLHLEARGGRRVSERENADLTFGVTEGTYCASDVERVLSELL